MEIETQHYEFLNNDIKKCVNLTANSCYTAKLDKSLKSIVKKEGYISCEIKKKEISPDGGNYLGTLYEVDVKGRTADGEKETAIFVKTITPNAIDIEILSLPCVYKTELFVYKNLIKIFNEVQDEAKVPIDERYNVVKSYEESYNEAIFLENVTRRGFKTWFRMDVVTLEMAEVCIKQLARLHGLSYVLEHKRPEYFAKHIKPLKTAFIFGKTWSGYIEKFYNIGMEYFDADVRRKIETKLKNILYKCPEYYLDDSIKYCMCHGDYRPNNIMVKEENGKVTEAIPVDYQLIYYGCPVLDFFYFMYMATDYKFRKAHMINLKNLYYESLDLFLRHFDMSAECVFPRKVFETLYEDKLDYGVVVTFLYTPFCFVSEDNVPDVTQETIVDVEFNVDDRFRDRITSAIQEFMDLGYF